jgi:hypothetical protein
LVELKVEVLLAVVGSVDKYGVVCSEATLFELIIGSIS